MMFKNRQSGDISNAMTGQIGANIRITGKIDADEAIGFGGQMDGDISADEVTVTDTASINGQITAPSAIIAGTVIGDIIKDTAIFKAHKATPIVVADRGEKRFEPYADTVFNVPVTEEHLAPILNTLVGHIWGYYAALAINGKWLFSKLAIL